MQDYYKIGKIVTVSGLKGELIVQHHLGKKTILPGGTAIFIADASVQLIPWFVENCKAKSTDEMLIKLEGVNSREEAMPLSRKEIWLQQPDFVKHTSKSAPISLLGYQVVEAGKILGIIEEVIEQPHQVLCSIYIDEKQVYIPLNESTLQKIEHSKKIVNVLLPDGLLDIYLQ